MRKSVTAVEVVDVEKRRLPSKHYVYVIQVNWDDGSSITIYRRYSNFFDLQTSLLETFPEEGGQLNPDERTIPFLPGKKYFGRSHIREVAEKRLGPIDKYCKLLIKLDKKISQCHEVLTFFEPTADDLSPKSKEKKPGEAKISKPKVLEQYEAIFDYQKQAKDQVDLKVGQSVQVIEKYETGWWLVNTEYEEGYAPGTFLQKTDGQEEEQMFTCNGEKYICTQSYTAEVPDDHTLNIGAEVEVLQKSLDGWWWVRYKGKIGWAPATCLKVADSISSHSANIPVEIVSNLSDVSKLLKGNDTTTDSPMAVSQRPKSTAETFTDFSSVSVEDSDNYEEVEESHYSRINSLYGNTSHTVLPPPRQNSIREKGKVPMNAEENKTKFITCAEYIDSVGDGISFSAGQEVEVQQKTDSGWYYIKLGSEFGWAPSSYLEEIPLDETHSSVRFDKIQEEKAEDDVDDDDDDEYETINLCPAKQIENILVSKLTPSNSQSDGLERNSSSSDELKLPLSSSPTGSSSSACPSTNSSLSRTAVKRPNSIPPAPPKRPDHPGGQPPLPSVPPVSSATKINSQFLPPPPPPPPPSSVPKKPVPPSSTGLYKSSKTSATCPPQPPPPHPGRPYSGISHPLVTNSVADHSKETSNSSGNLATELQARLAKLKANFDSGSSASTKKQQPLTKEKPVIIHGVNIKGGATLVAGNSSKVTKTKDIKKPQPQVFPPHVQKTTPIFPASSCNVDDSLSQAQKDDIQRIPVPNVSDSSVVVPSSKFAEKLSVFQMNTNGDNAAAAAAAKFSSPNVPLASNCRGLALLQRQKDRFMEEAESNCKASNESLECEAKVSNLRNSFESSTCKLSTSSIVPPDLSTNVKPAPPTKPIHKVKPTTVPAKANPNLPVKPKVSPCKPKFGTVTNTGKKDSTTNIANKINKFGGNNLASPAKISATEMEPPKFQLVKEKVMTPTNQTQQNTAKEMRKSNTDFNINSVIQRVPKSTDRSYKASSRYIAESEGEMSFEKGVDIEVLEKHESGWWLVHIGDGEGWAPSNHIAEVKPLPPTKPLPPNKPLPKLPSNPSTKSTNQTAKPVISINTASLSENNNKNENNNNNNKEFITNEDTLAPLGSGGQFVALSDFSAFEEGEISIEEGMFVKILDSSSTDKWHVMLQSGEDGWVPANCIGTIHDV